MVQVKAYHLRLDIPTLLIVLRSYSIPPYLVEWQRGGFEPHRELTLPTLTYPALDSCSCQYRSRANHLHQSVLSRQSRLCLGIYSGVSVSFHSSAIRIYEDRLEQMVQPSGILSKSILFVVRLGTSDRGHNSPSIPDKDFSVTYAFSIGICFGALNSSSSQSREPFLYSHAQDCPNTMGRIHE